MYASQDLINEHEGILFGLTILEKMANEVEQLEEIEVRDIEEMVNFFKLFADKCHHGKEEGLMFPAMERVGVSNEEAPMEQLMLEHEEGRKYIAGMDFSINNGALEGEKFILAARSYISLMRGHIDRENSILFPLGDKLIPMEEQKQLLEKFEEFEEIVMGEGIHEKLHELLHDFEAKYLKAIEH
ncbi:MAG: hemerythrin domain-containing protein [Anaerovoracaceae bacterium]|jgi:hemerythrin-like domain-containing protein